MLGHVLFIIAMWVFFFFFSKTWHCSLWFQWIEQMKIQSLSSLVCSLLAATLPLTKHPTHHHGIALPTTHGSQVTFLLGVGEEGRLSHCTTFICHIRFPCCLKAGLLKDNNTIFYFLAFTTMPNPIITKKCSINFFIELN